MANGLTTKEEQALRERLKQLDAVLARRHLMGAGEAHTMMELADDIRQRLDPANPEALQERADRMLSPITGFGGLTWVQTIMAGLPR